MDPSGQKSYIFYDETAFSKQAESEKNRLTHKYGEDEVDAFAVNDPFEFKDKWDSLDEDIDEVVLMYHGHPHAVIIGGSGLVTNSEGTTSNNLPAVKITDLSKKNIDIITINSCNTGHLDHYNNVATTFLTSQNVGLIKSWDGSMVYNKQLGFRDYGWGYYEGVLANSQHYFKSWVLTSKKILGIEIQRGPMGKVEYWIDENGDIQTRTWVYSSLEGKIEIVRAFSEWYIGNSCCDK